MKGYNPNPAGYNPGKNTKEAKKEEAIENIRNAISELDFKNVKKAEDFLEKALNILNEIE